MQMKMKSSLFLASILLSPAFVIAAEGGPSLPAQPAPSLRDGGPAAVAPWVPFAAERDIEPGSALDFSWIAAAHAPCGVHGRVVVRDGHFEFEGRPGEPVRFWGVNISSGANFPDEDKAEAIAAHLAALGYNAVRIHHHDGGLVAQNPDTTVLSPDALRRHDALVAACSRHGLYIVTDLYVSRPVSWRAVGIDRDGTIGKGAFKHLVPVHDGAFSNFCAFASAWLGHTNAFTGVRFADDPALLSVALINEGRCRTGRSAGPAGSQRRNHAETLRRQRRRARRRKPSAPLIPLRLRVNPPPSPTSPPRFHKAITGSARGTSRRSRASLPTSRRTSRRGRCASCARRSGSRRPSRT